MSTKALFQYIGGKFYIADWIISHFPEHSCFIDLFGGTGVILLNKKPSKIEIYNDKNELIVNFLMQVRDNGEKLTEALTTLPYSRALYNKWRKEPLPEDSFEKAIRFFYLTRSSFNGLMSWNSWGYSVTCNFASGYQSAIDRIKLFQNRFKRVQIECLDFRNVIGKYDSFDTLFYIDPPYYGKKYYSEQFTEQDHIDLAVILNNVKGKVCLSYYDNPLIEKYYKHWNRNTIEAIKFSYGLVGDNKNGVKPRETELLLMNYELKIIQNKLI